MIFYRYFSGQGRADLMNALVSTHLLTMLPWKVVEVLLAAGYRANVKEPSAEPWPQTGIVTEVERDGQLSWWRSAERPKKFPSKKSGPTRICRSSE